MKTRLEHVSLGTSLKSQRVLRVRLSVDIPDNIKVGGFIDVEIDAEDEEAALDLTIREIHELANKKASEAFLPQQ